MAVKNSANGSTAENTKSAGKLANKKSGELRNPLSPETVYFESKEPEGGGKLPLDSPEFKPIIRDLIRLAK